MATYNTNTALKQTAANAGKLSPAELGGRVRLAHGSITPESAYASGTVIRLARLPKGARLLPTSQIHFEAGQGASMTVKIGDSKDDDRYFAAAAPGASATTITLNANRLGDYTLEDEDFISLTTGTAALTANKKIYFDLFYALD